MVHNHLNSLTNSIAEIHPSMMTGITEESLQNWIGFIAVSAEHIRHHLKNEAFGLDNEKQMEYFVQTHQLAFLTIISDLQNYINIVSGEHPHHERLRKFYLSITTYIQAILNFILQHFSKYFNMRMEVPFNYLPVVRTELGEEIQAIREKLSSLETIQLLTIAMEPITEFVENEAMAITYRQLQYFKAVISEIKEIDPKEDVNCAIRTALFYLNFNSRQFLKYALDLVLGEVEAVEYDSERKDKLLWVVKSLKQLRIKPNSKLNENDLGVYEYVLQYVSEEADYLQNRLQTVSEETVVESPMEEKEQKINTTLSLSQLAAFFKVLFETDVITNRIKMDVWRILAACIRTDKKKAFAAESLRALYNNVDPATGKSIIDLTFKLLNTARKLY